MTIFSKAPIPICRIKVALKPASSILLTFINVNFVDLWQILKQGLHSPNCYTHQVAQLIRHTVDPALHRTTFFAKKYYMLRNLLRNLRNIQAEAKNCVSYKKHVIWYRPITIEWDHFVSCLRNWTKYQEHVFFLYDEKNIMKKKKKKTDEKKICSRWTLHWRISANQRRRIMSAFSGGIEMEHWAKIGQY